MNINGLPAHALVVHAAVIFGPLGSLVALAYIGLSSRRDQLRWPMVLIGVVAALSVLAAYLSGKNLVSNHPALQQLADVQTHESRARVTLWIVLAFGLVSVAAGALHQRRDGLRVAVLAVLGLAAVATLVAVVLTGDAGAHALWGGLA